MNVKKQRIIIHTGPGKTGSSAIQAWLTKNTKRLELKGVLYPKHDLSKDKISSGNLREILTQQEDSSWQVDAEKVKELLIKFKKSDFSILLLSSEFFFHRIIQIQKVIPEAEFIAYIRNPVELLESNYNQSVKRHSNSTVFITPNGVSNFLWQYLDKVFTQIDNQKLYLRPFNEHLMQDGHIVPDLLSVLNVKFDDEWDDKRINPSFTFHCLEFKRLINHFGLGPLEQHLDKALQCCDIGVREYSLITPEKFKLLNSESCEKMTAFIEKFSLSSLRPLLEKFKSVQQRPYLEQQATFEQLNKIAVYLKTFDESLYNKIQRLLQIHSNLVVDNLLIFKVFTVKPEQIDEKELINELLFKHINQFTVHPNKKGKICYELASFYLIKNDLINAFMYAKAAYYFNPGNHFFIEKLNEILLLINVSKLENKLSIDQSSNKVSTINKFKNLASYFSK